MVNIKNLSHLHAIDVIIWNKIAHVHEVFGQPSYIKRDDFDFAIVNFPFLCTNIPLSSAYGVYMSQLIRYARACFVYDDFKTWQPDDKKS